MHALLDVNCGHGSIELKIVKKEVSKKSKMLNFQSEIIHQFDDRKMLLNNASLLIKFVS